MSNKINPDERQYCGCLEGQPCDCEFEMVWIVSCRNGVWEYHEDLSEEWLSDGYMFSHTHQQWFMPGGDGSPRAMEVDDLHSMQMTNALALLNAGTNPVASIKERLTELETQLKMHMRTNNKQEMAVTLGYMTGLEYALELLKGKTNG